jgi:hypothetical protein
MNRTVYLLSVLAAGMVGSACAPDTPAPDQEPDAGELVSALKLGDLCEGEGCDSLIRGAIAFVDRHPPGLGGNGRSCADCHLPGDAFQLSPASVEARFSALQARRRRHPEADDPLFRPIDADDFRINGQAASDFGNLRRNGLVRVVMPLPPTVKLVDPETGLPSAETSVDLWRAVPTVVNVKLTGPDPDPPSWPCVVGGPTTPPCSPRGPNPNGGYQLDARVSTLQEQARGALVNHAQVERSPSPRLLDDLASFQSVLFSSPGLRATSQGIDEGVTPALDPDPPLDQLERKGKEIFVRACTTCHAGAAGTHPAAGLVRFHNIQTACPRPVDGPQFPGYAGTPRFAFAPCKPELARNVRLYQLTLPDGTTTRRPSSDPGRTLLSGFFLGGGPRDDWQSLEAASTRGVSRTAPYFHNNSAATLDEVLDHYTEFFKFVAATVPPRDPQGATIPRPAPISTDGVHIDRPFTREERPALLAYLRKL